MSMPPAPAPADPKAPRPPWFRTVALVVGPTLMALLTLVAAAWLAMTPIGLRAAATLANSLVPGLTLSGVEGSIGSGHLRIAAFGIERRSWSVRAEEIAVDLHDWSLAEPKIGVESARARRVQIEWAASGEPASAPPSLGAPFDLEVRQASIQELTLGARGARPLVFRRLTFAGQMNPRDIDVARLSGEFERMHIEAQGRIGARSPFETEASARFVASLRQRDVTADATAGGSLQQLQVELQADDDAARARVSTTLRLFDKVTFERLLAEVDDFDPALWFTDVPSMRLRAHADLVPVHQPDGNWSVSGHFSAENFIPGPVDQNRIPIRSARGTLAWSAETLRLDLARVDGVRGSGSGTLNWSAATGVEAAARFSGIDASTLHSRAVVTNAAGELEYRYRAGEQRFSGNARNTGGLALAAEVEGSLRQRVLELARARLRLGEGRADLHGRVELDGARTARVAGNVSDLDLSQLVRGLDTRLNGTFDADGHLSPLDGRARFALAESRLAGRPIAGHGSVDVGDGRFDADVEVRSGESRLTAVGGIGAGRELRIELTSPEIETLMPAYGGEVAVRAKLAGDFDTARVDGSASGRNLRLPGGHRIASIVASFSGGMAAKQPLAIRLDLTGHAAPGGPEQSLAAATLIGRGTTSGAAFELNGTTVAKQPVRVLANGGISNGAWRGSLVAAEVGAPLDLLLSSPAPLIVSTSSAALGPADFTLRGAHFSAFELQFGDGGWRTSGRFSNMQPQALDAQARAPRRVVRSGAGDRVPLTLAGRWELIGADGVNGIAVIERTGGDLYSGIDALNPIGISDVGAALSILDSRITGNVYVRGRALGKIDAGIDAYLDPRLSGGRLLAQDRPLRIVVDSTLPDLSWVGPLIGDNVQFGGSATINTTIGGTPADPTSSGSVRGEALRLAWVDQAVRLENGRLDAVLDDGVLVINELRFAGTPRIAPADLRALEGLESERPFEVRAVGRFALRSLTGSIGLQATQLPVLQRGDRWMVVSGDAGITLSPGRAELYAKLQADGAYINFAGLRSARSLPNDVVLTHVSTARKTAPTAPPLEVTLDVNGNLGQRFYIKGAGIEARLAGAVHVSGRPSQLRATGSVNAVDGVYSGYGQRLQIQRGIVTFQGPLDNPSLNVLAVRSGLPVEVGVAISGTAQRPLVSLYSDPSMSDTEKLNWLVLGRPPGANDGRDRAMLSAAASAIFAGQVDSASAGLMRSLGIDQITLQPGQSGSSLLPRETVAGRLRSSGLTTSNSAAADFVAVGKRINDDLYLSFEQALSGAEYFVALNYRLTQQLSLIARAGSTNALDLVFSIAFD